MIARGGVMQSAVVAVLPPATDANASLNNSTRRR
jgi:hypothetical protein